MAWNEKYVTATGTDTYANASNSSTPCSLATAIAGVAAGDRVNVQAGSYSNTTTTRTLSTSGTTTAPIWWRGYQATPGDMDGTASHGTFMSGTNIPALSFTTGAIAISGSQQHFTNFDIQGAQTGTTAQLRALTGSNIRVARCRIENTAANAAGRAVANTGANNAVFESCYFKSTSSAENVLDASGTFATYAGCVFFGGANGLLCATTSIIVLYHCSFNGTGGDAVRWTTSAARLWVLGCTFYSPGSDGIEVTVAPTFAYAADNIFSVTTIGINNSSGGNVNTVVRTNNLFHSWTTGPEAGFGDSPSLNQQTDTSSPFTNAAGGDLSIVSGSNAKANGLPGPFEGQIYTSYLDIGAVQRQESGGTVALAFPMTGRG